MIILFRSTNASLHLSFNLRLVHHQCLYSHCVWPPVSLLMTLDLQEPADHPDCQRSLAQTSRSLGTHAATVLVSRLRTTYDGGMSVVWRSRALSLIGCPSRRHQMTVLELIIVVLHCRKDGHVGLCVFVHDIVRSVER